MSATPITLKRIQEIRCRWSAGLASGHIKELADALESKLASVQRLTEEADGFRRLVASVPDLVKSAFQEGFRNNGNLALGPSWDRSATKAALDGQATPRPPEWDADKSRISDLEARVTRLTELRDALVESLESMGGIPMTDRLADALASSGVDAVREVEAVVKEPSTTARRSDAGRVEVPTLTPRQIKMAEACCDEDDYPPLEEWALDGKLGALADLVAVLYRSRLSPSPQPSADVVVVPRDEWECIQRIVKAGRNWLTDSKDNAVEDLSFELTQLNWIRNPADALRSSTNHDGEEAPHA